VAGLLVLLVILGTIAWLTQHPEAEVVRQAQEWPVVGPLAKWFRQAYLPSPKPPAHDAIVADDPELVSADEVEVVVVSPSPDEVGARPQVWVPAGTPVYAEPDATSSVLETLPSLSNLSRLEQRGDWYRVRRPRTGQPPLKGWVFLEDYQVPQADLLRQPDPVLPLPAASPDAGRVAAARALMTAGGVAMECGVYPLYTDVEETGFSSLCARLVRQLEALYAERYGLQPVSPPAEAILAFRRQEAYEIFRDHEGVDVESSLAHASPPRGYLALPVNAGDRTETLAVLVHELTHLLNRRSIGPALPPWLGEGLADDLAASRIDSDGSLHPDTLGGERWEGENSVVRWGGLASIILIREALDRDQLPTLEELVLLDRQEFHRTENARLHYALSSFWVRYFASGFEPSLRTGFRTFLRDVASGQPLTEELLLTRLGSDWKELESSFRLWVRLQYIPPPNETRVEPPRDGGQGS
jgi:hypothetical protein